jgi:hypothetical protein
MAEYEKQLWALDNRIKARDEEKKGSRNSMEQFTTTPVTSYFTSGGLALMDLSVTQWQNQKSTTCPAGIFHHELINGIK